MVNDKFSEPNFENFILLNDIDSYGRLCNV